MTYIPDPYTQEIINDLEFRNRVQREQLKSSKRAQATLAQPDKGLRDRIDILNNQIDRLNSELAKKDTEILEWMHTNAAFKKLTKDYAIQLGIPEKQRIENVRQARLDVAEEDPALKHTELYKETLAKLQQGKSEGTS